MDKNLSAGVKLISIVFLVLFSVGAIAYMQISTKPTDMDTSTPPLSESLIPSTNPDSVAIFVDKQTYSSLTSEIDRLKEDITNDLGAEVFIFSDDWEEPEKIKNILVEKYRNSGLIGSILIGDIPAAYIDGSLTDWYYQDLIEGQQVNVEVWTGRIKPPIGGAEGLKLLRNYLNRDHDYRTGKFTYNQEMLYYGSSIIREGYMDETKYKNMVSRIGGYTGLYDTDQAKTIYDPDIAKEKSDYLRELSQNREFIFIFTHGSTTSQWVGGDTDVTSDEIKEAAPNALFTVMATCSNGDFTEENYFAGCYLFSGNSLMVTANSVASMILGAGEDEFFLDYKPLRLGVTFGEMHKNDRTWRVTQLLGDPTLRLREKPTENIPRLKIDTTSLDYGRVKGGSEPCINILFQNEGNKTLQIEYIKGEVALNGVESELEYADFFSYTPDNGNSHYTPFEILPGKSKSVPFTFNPRKDGPIGKYTMQMLFQTNDPNKPYLVIDFTGIAKAE